MKRTYEEVVGIEAMVDKVLTENDVVAICDAYYQNTKYHNQPIEYPTVYALINNAIYHSWDGVNHEGVLVVIKETEKSDGDYYFMERTWAFNGTESPSELYKAATPVWHALMPVDIGRSKAVSDCKVRTHLMRLKNTGLNMEEFARLIVDSCIYDDIEFPTDKSSRFCINEATEIRYFESAIQKSVYNEWKKTAIEKLISGTVTAGDNLWDELCVGQLREELYNVFRALREKGHRIRLDGERDSFGWVTCGIVMDGKLMTSMYF